jgi:hypothetical protein
MVEFSSVGDALFMIASVSVGWVPATESKRRSSFCPHRGDATAAMRCNERTAGARRELRAASMR